GYRPLTLRREMVVLNPLTYAPLLALAYLAYRGLRPSLRAMPPLRGEEAAEGAVEVVRPPRLKGMAGIYFQAVMLVEGFTGIPLRPSDTVREYLARVRGLIGRGARPFGELTRLLEEAVYGGREVDLEEAGRLLAELREVIG
ncbi:MAG: hypothetical protein DRO06_01905, partial [Thermoproteota archaeon]